MAEFAQTKLLRLAGLIIVLVLFIVSIKSSALLLPNASILAGSSVPSAVTSHSFLFDIATAGTLGSVRFEYCSNSPVIGAPCTAPAGLDVSSASLSAQAGETGFSIDVANTDANHLVIIRASAVAVTGPVSYGFSGAVNPSTPNAQIFIRIMTYASGDASGPYTDAGVAILNTAGNVSTSGYVPSYIVACVGVTVALDCSSTTGSSADFGTLSTTQAKTVTSQLAVATNDPFGYTTYVLGATLTSDNNVIPAMVSPSASNPGISQFGLNLRANTNPTIGSDAEGVGSATVQANYNGVNQFQFVNNTAVSKSVLPTEHNRFTASYIANISPTQGVGSYSTGLTYLTIAGF